MLHYHKINLFELAFKALNDIQANFQFKILRSRKFSGEDENSLKVCKIVCNLNNKIELNSKSPQKVISILRMLTFI